MFMRSLNDMISPFAFRIWFDITYESNWHYWHHNSYKFHNITSVTCISFEFDQFKKTNWYLCGMCNSICVISQFLLLLSLLLLLCKEKKRRKNIILSNTHSLQVKSSDNKFINCSDGNFHRNVTKIAPEYLLH